MRWPGPLPGRSPPPPHFSVGSPPSPPPSGGHGIPTWIGPSCGALRRGAPLWLRTLCISLLLSELGHGGQSQPVWSEDRWLPSWGSVTWRPERGLGGRCPVTHPLPPGMPSLWPRWHIAQRPTPDGRNYAVPRMRSAGDDVTTCLRWPLSPASLPSSPPAKDHAPPLTPRSPRGSCSPSQSEACIPWRRPPPAIFSGETRPRCSWLAPISCRTGPLTLLSHQGDDRFPWRCYPPQLRPHTRAVWRRGGPSTIFGWGGVSPAHMSPLTVYLPCSPLPYCRGSNLSCHPPWSPVWPSGGSSWIQTAHHWATHGAPPTAWLCGSPHLTHYTFPQGRTSSTPPRHSISTRSAPRGPPLLIFTRVKGIRQNRSILSLIYCELLWMMLLLLFKECIILILKDIWRWHAIVNCFPWGLFFVCY